MLVKRQGAKPLSGKALSTLLSAVLSKGACFRFSARGFSMAPFIQDGDIITIRPLDGGKLRVGDVVAISDSRTDTLTVHRIIAKKRDSYIVKGDNNYEDDERVSLERILGIVQTIERNGKNISMGLGKERWFIAILARRNVLIPLLRKIRMLRYGAHYVR